MTKKWDLLLKLLNSFDNTFEKRDSNFSKQLSKLVYECATNSLSLLCKVLIYFRSRSSINSKLINYIAALVQPYLSNTNHSFSFYSKRAKRDNTGGIIFCANDMDEIMEYYFLIYNKVSLPNGMLKAFSKNLSNYSFEELSNYPNNSLKKLIKLCHVSPNDNKHFYYKDGEKLSAISAIILGNKCKYFDIKNYLNNFNPLSNDLKKFCFFIVKERHILSQGITCMDIELFLDSVSKFHFPDEDLFNFLVNSLNTAYNIALRKLKSILKGGKTLIIYNSFNSMEQNSVNYNYSCNEFAASIASAMFKSSETDLVKFDLRAGYIHSLDRESITLTKSIREAKIDCDTIQSSWELVTLLPQDYTRIIILNDGSYNKNTVNFSNNLKYLGSPYIYNYDLSGKTERSFKKSYLNSIPFSVKTIYEDIEKTEFNYNLSDINNLNFYSL